MFGKVVNIPFLSYKTHAIIFGDITKKMPIVVLHGGPGGCVERYEALTLLQDEIPLVFYDQLGSGYSKVPKGHFELMNFETFERLDKYINETREDISKRNFWSYNDTTLHIKKYYT